uniref:Uncharacterized protein n=1 Tax=Lotharella oceanica TaxID=641309 RepID=A0A7S2TNT4_9EUKA|mmetsp:Transcript_22769/g.42775  ORF Transcript_22769/g.42775 Transcript_22769/m.42775 type:complete len:239 (+) Transcript_22769:19-735(+)
MAARARRIAAIAASPIAHAFLLMVLKVDALDSLHFDVPTVREEDVPMGGYRENLIAKLRSARRRADVFRAVADNEKSIRYTEVLRCIRKAARLPSDCSGSSRRPLRDFERAVCEKLVNRIPEELRLLNATEVVLVIGDVLCLQATGLVDEIDGGIRMQILGHLKRARDEVRSRLPQDFVEPDFARENANMTTLQYAFGQEQLPEDHPTRARKRRRRRSSRSNPSEHDNPSDDTIGYAE